MDDLAIRYSAHLSSPQPGSVSISSSLFILLTLRSLHSPVHTASLHHLSYANTMRAYQNLPSLNAFVCSEGRGKDGPGYGSRAAVAVDPVADCAVSRRPCPLPWMHSLCCRSYLHHTPRETSAVQMCKIARAERHGKSFQAREKTSMLLIMTSSFSKEIKEGGMHTVEVMFHATCPAPIVSKSATFAISITDTPRGVS